MVISVYLQSDRHGEIKRFLEMYYEKVVDIDDDVEKWIYTYAKPLEAVDIISVVVDNMDKFNINLCIQVDNKILHQVTADNHNDIIKGIFSLFYDETVIEECM
jgi:hypothetical protein